MGIPDKKFLMRVRIRQALPGRNEIIDTSFAYNLHSITVRTNYKTIVMTRKTSSNV